MAKKNQYYVVVDGRRPGIYNTWGECKSQVNKYHGAKFKGFSSEAEAFEFAGEELTKKYLEKKKAKMENSSFQTNKEEAIAYVDGSYNDCSGQYGCGIVFFYNGKEEHISQAGNNINFSTMRNVAGEIMGARIAMEKAVEYGVKKLTIIHDYQGIASWCTGEWQATKDGTREYRDYFNSVKDKVNIQFKKVKGHSGDRYNDLADELAKNAIF